MPIPSKKTASRILETIEAVNNMTGPATQRPRRRIRTGGSGGSSLIWLTTDNTGLSFADGAKYDRPAGTGTALTSDDTYYISDKQYPLPPQYKPNIA